VLEASSARLPGRQYEHEVMEEEGATYPAIQGAQAARPPSEAVPWAQGVQVVSEVTVQGKAMYLPIPQVVHGVQEDLPEED